MRVIVLFIVMVSVCSDIAYCSTFASDTGQKINYSSYILANNVSLIERGDNFLYIVRNNNILEAYDNIGSGASPFSVVYDECFIYAIGFNNSLVYVAIGMFMYGECYFKIDMYYENMTFCKYSLPCGLNPVSYPYFAFSQESAFLIVGMPNALLKFPIDGIFVYMYQNSHTFHSLFSNLTHPLICAEYDNIYKILTFNEGFFEVCTIEESIIKAILIGENIFAISNISNTYYVKLLNIKGMPIDTIYTTNTKICNVSTGDYGILITEENVIYELSTNGEIIYKIDIPPAINSITFKGRNLVLLQNGSLIVFERDIDGDELPDYKEMEYGTDPFSYDTDSDGMSDGWEVRYSLNPLENEAYEDPDSDDLLNIMEYLHLTNPMNKDTDDDKMPDGWEVRYSLNPKEKDELQDPDADGLVNVAEYGYHTHPRNRDTDGDGLLDGQEVREGLDPLNSDTDGDSMPDGWELLNALNSKLNDSYLDCDGDGLTNKEEFNLGTNPRKKDSDNDGLGDKFELDNGLNPINEDTDKDDMPDGWEIKNKLNPLLNDANEDNDNDGLSNIMEYRYKTDPNNKDSDADMLHDGIEINRGTNPTNPDTDGDGLADGLEVGIGSNPLSKDTDGDGIDDLAEYNLGILASVNSALLPGMYFVIIGVVAAISVYILKLRKESNIGYVEIC